MSYTPVVLMQRILENRQHIDNMQQIEEYSAYLFDLALRDREAAEALLTSANRFVANITKMVTKEKLIEFAKVHNADLVNSLIKLAKVEASLAAEMRKAVVNKYDLDKKYNELLDEILKKIAPSHFDGEVIHEQTGRTVLAIKNNPYVIEQNKIPGIKHKDEFIPMVTRDTRDFNQKLCSVGSSTEREIILLDPNDILLQGAYETLKQRLPKNADPLTIFKEINKLTQQCFKGHSPEAFVKENLNKGKVVISLSAFIFQGQGVCRPIKRLFLIAFSTGWIITWQRYSTPPRFYGSWSPYLELISGETWKNLFAGFLME